MKTIAALLVSTCTVLAQPTNGVPPPVPDSPETFWTWLIGGVAALFMGVAVYLIRRKNASKS